MKKVQYLFLLSLTFIDKEETDEHEGGILSQLITEETKESVPKDLSASQDSPSLLSMEDLGVKDIDENRREEIIAEYGIGKTDFVNFKSKIRQKGHIKKDDPDVSDINFSNLEMFDVEVDEGRVGF
jgi:hypothetical protein